MHIFKYEVKLGLDILPQICRYIAGYYTLSIIYCCYNMYSSIINIMPRRNFYQKINQIHFEWLG